MDPKIESLEVGGGNTETPPIKKKQPLQVLHHCFTWNNYENRDIETLISFFEVHADKYAFQEETGASGTRHLQGVVSLHKAMRYTEFGLPKCIHWETTRHLTRSYEYATKDETRTGEVYVKNYAWKKPTIKLINPTKWWQQEILEIFRTEPDERKVHWYWSVGGGVGKSSFVKYCAVKHKAIFIDEGKKSDIMNVLINSGINQDLRPVIFDLPRANGNKVSYKSIESIKNGMIYSGKYEGGQMYFNSPHVVVFANEPPDLNNKLSMDRWVIKNIDELSEFYHE